MLLQGHEAFVEKLSKLDEFLGMHATEDVDELLRKLERCLLELKTSAWEAGEKEPEVNVDDVAMRINEEVLVVPVFDLEDIACERVSGETSAEGTLGLLVRLRFRIAFAEVVHKVVIERHVMLPVDLV